MPYSNKQMLRDANGDLIPQYWDVVEQDFKPLTGQGGANDVRLTGSKVDYQNLFERKIRTETEDVFTIVPDDAIGAIIQLSIHGITGNVSRGGLSLRVRNFATSKLFLA